MGNGGESGDAPMVVISIATLRRSSKHAEEVTPTNAIDINTISDPIEEEDYMYFTNAQTERA